VRPIRTGKYFRNIFHIGKLSQDSQHSQSSEKFSSVVCNGSWGSDGISGSSNSWGSNSRGSLDMVRVGDDWGSNGLLDDWLTLDWDRDMNIVWGINMDWGWDLDDLFGVERSIIRGIIRLVDKDGLLDIVDLSLGLDNWGVDGLGSLQDSWDSNWKMWGSGLKDSGVVSGDIAGLSIVNLLGHNWSWLVHSCHTLSLGNCGVWSWGSWGNIVDGVGDNSTSGVVLRSISWDGCWGSSSNCGHSWGGNSIVRWSAIGTSKNKSESHKRFHDARYPLLSC